MTCGPEVVFNITEVEMFRIFSVAASRASRRISFKVEDVASLCCVKVFQAFAQTPEM